MLSIKFLKLLRSELINLNMLKNARIKENFKVDKFDSDLQKL